MKLIFTLSLLLLPALAQADVVYKCKSVVDMTDLSADLRFDDNGQAGHLELNAWTSYPPATLVYDDLKAPKTLGSNKIFPTSLNGNSRVDLQVPSDFLSQDYFAAMITEIRAGKPQKPYLLDCNRF